MLSVWEKYLEVSNFIEEEQITGKLKSKALKLLNDFERVVQELQMQSKLKLKLA